jgi:molecular chaperone GrpE
MGKKEIKEKAEDNKEEGITEDIEIEEKSELEKLQSKLEEAEKKVEDNYDQLLRTKAEFQNYKKRMEKEKNDIIQYAGEKIFRELILFIIDNLEMTLINAIESQNNKAIIEGMEMILNQLTKDLDRFGVKQIESLGKTFDPTIHEAVSQTINSETTENSITEEIQKGYMYYDRLLRPAKVCVSIPPKEEEENKGDKKPLEESKC